MFYQGVSDFLYAFTDERWQGTLEALQTAGKAVADWYDYLAKLDQELSGNLGIPHFLGALTQVPFDVVSLFFRGWEGSVFDMYRRPEKLQELMETVLPWLTDFAIRNAEVYGHPVVELYIYKGADVFMGEEQFKTFYWPTLKKVVMALIEKDLIPWIWTQGTYDRHLKYFGELPKGSCFVHLEAGTDIFKAKQVIGDTLCIEGNVPNSLLATGTPDQVRDYCKRLIDECAPGGGYMMDFSALLDECRPENLEAMVKTTIDYGKY
jgi:uroporphyrinogen-III decarboxylase